MIYMVKCDECKETIRSCRTVGEAAAGGVCSWCRKELARKTSSPRRGHYASGVQACRVTLTEVSR